ncbi:MAG: 50S ribosomal protein L4 [Pseudomonadota bacterium]|nr:50S ribosomal protein L4 [Pseudomonadota bacterium]
MATVIKVQNSKKKIDVTLPDSVFALDYKESLIHQVVTAYQSGARAGSKAQKTRSQVSGGGAKPWRQKGTGRARAGTSRSPIWRGGGRAFAACPRSFAKKINKKMYKTALKSMLSELLRQERFSVIEKMNFIEPKTKKAKEILDKLKISSALIVIKELDENTLLSFRNIPSVSVVKVSELNPLLMMRHENLVLTNDALDKIEEMLG